MGSFNNYSRNAILNYVFGGTAFSSPANVYFGLSTTTIAQDGTGVTEPGAGSYARKTETNNKTTWTVSTAGALANAIAITFVTATASWGDITDFFIADAITSGNLLGYGVLTTPRTVENGTTLEFPIGDLDVTLA